MRYHVLQLARAIGFGLLVLSVGGCANKYRGIVRPTPELGVLSPEAARLTDDDIESYLQVSARTVFPTVLAVAKLAEPRGYYRNGHDGRLTVDHIHADEADGWRRATKEDLYRTGAPIRQVHIINKLALSGEETTLQSLRVAAAKLHAPLLLAYIQEDNWASGYNSAAMAYWTIVGMFFVPGDTVGHHSICEGILVDTRTGAIVATVAGEAKREENVLPGAVPIARNRTREQSRREAVTRFQEDLARILRELATDGANAEADNAPVAADPTGGDVASIDDANADEAHLADAREHLVKARKLIDNTGCHRRDPELKDLDARAG